MPNRSRVAGYVTVAAFLWTVGCAPAPAPDTRAADEAVIKKADADWAKGAQTKSIDTFMSFYAPDAVVLPPNEKIATDAASIKASIGGMLALPNLKIDWQATKVEVARSGDIGYLYGTYDLSFDGPKGKRVTDKGKLVEIWRKQPDGAWKCIVDTFNSDMPAAN